MTNIDKMIEVMQAYKDGAEIECMYRFDLMSEWATAPNPDWSWDIYNYRVKEPEPTKGQVWAVLLNGVRAMTGVTYKNTLVFRGDINNTPAVYGTKAEAERLAKGMRESNPELVYTVMEVVL